MRELTIILQTLSGTFDSAFGVLDMVSFYNNCINLILEMWPTLISHFNGAFGVLNGVFGVLNLLNGVLL